MTINGSSGSGVPDPDRGLLIAQDLFRSMLPQCEAKFRRELWVWHPELGYPWIREYLSTHSYPRCWIFTAAMIFAAAHTEYARALLESLRGMPDVVHEDDNDFARPYGDALRSRLNEAPWRRLICRVSVTLCRARRGGRKSLIRAFGVGLNFAFAEPAATRRFVDVVRAEARESYDWQVGAATVVVRRHPIQR